MNRNDTWEELTSKIPNFEFDILFQTGIENIRCMESKWEIGIASYILSEIKQIIDMNLLNLTF